MSGNKKQGSAFERYMCDKLAAAGFWVHNFASREYGQPADIIAVRNGWAYLIDCKSCSGNVFDLRRIEENQELAMRRWTETGNGAGWFAILSDGEIYMTPNPTFFVSREKQQTMTIEQIKSTWGTSFEEWLETCE
jgi:Holliday junction resolvase